jgi:hypothetical protein
LGGAAAGQIFRVLIEWTKERWKHEHAQHPGELVRPRSVIIWDPDGRPLKSVTVDRGANGDEPVVEDRPLDDIPERPRP